MDNFKTYYLANEGISSQIAGMGKKVASGLKKGGQRIKKAATSDEGIGQKVAGVADAVVDTGQEVGSDIATTEIGGTEDQAPGIESIKTFEDLKEVITGIVTQKHKGRVKGAVSSAVLGMIPGVGQAKDAGDVLKAIADTPDEVETQTGSVIDKLVMDPQLATIVDDKIEDNFLAHMQKKIEKETGPIPADWSINTELKQYLAAKFGGRTVTGEKA